MQARKASVHDILQIVRHGNLFDVLVPDQISQAVIDGVTGPARNDHVLSVAFVGFQEGVPGPNYFCASVCETTSTAGGEKPVTYNLRKIVS